MRSARPRLTPLAVVLAVALAACGGSNGGAATKGSTGQTAATKPTALVGEVGKNDAFHIQMSDKDGKALVTVAPGTYPLTVHDESSIHNFHLTGPGVDISTGVGTTGDQHFSVTLRKGTYRYVCDPHSGQMHGSFTVT